MKSKIKFVVLYLKGVAMGSADVVPGVSGGTIALITGIYEELIRSIRSFDTTALSLLFKKDLKGVWNHVNGWFLLVLFAGIATAILSLSKIIVYLLLHHPQLLWSFFFGLIAASAIMVSKHIKIWTRYGVLSAIIGAILGYSITIAIPVNTPETLWFIFLSGAIAICAMILPGISGSFILLLLGKYQYVLAALKNVQLDVIIVFSAGAAVGLISFSHLLNRMLEKFHDVTVALLIGVMIGSLNKVWPWKIALETYIDRHGEIKPLVERNALPALNDPNLAYAIVLAITGFVLVCMIEYGSRKRSSS